MGDFLRQILDHIKELWPIRVVDPDHQGVLFDRGRTAISLAPGYHWFIPGIQRIETIAVVYQELDCQLQTVETLDGIAVTFSANIGFEVRDAARARTAVHDVDATLERSARGALGKFVTERKWSDLTGHASELVSDARKAVADDAAGWGVKIVRVRLTDFARSRIYRVLGGTHPLAGY
jgi:regulator of protease activity HflC (stomatin/prohibitin superfamily)